MVACLSLQVAVVIFNMQEGALSRTFLGSRNPLLPICIGVFQCGRSPSLLHLSIASHLSITHLFSEIDLIQYNRILFLEA